MLKWLKSPFSILKSRSLFSEGASVVHAQADSVVHADDDDDDGDDDADDDDDDDDDDDACNEVKQRVWLVDPTLFFPSPTPPPEVEV